MRMTAPDRWLNGVNVLLLRRRLLDDGWLEDTPSAGWLTHPTDDCLMVALPQNIREFRDWQRRLLEAVEIVARMDGITAAEWFLRQGIAS